MIRICRVFSVLAYFFAAAFLGALISLLRPFNPDNTRICGRLFSWGGLKLLGMRLSIEGQEYLTNRSPSVIIANHQDNLDLFVHGGVIPSRTVSVGKKSLRYLPLFGQMYWLAGNILIDRSNKNASANLMTETRDALINKNTSIWVFAEGTRSKGEALLPFKKGAFHMAVQAGVPIIPICASNYAKHINLKKRHAGDVIVKVLPPISTSGMTEKDIPVLIATAHSQMETCIASLDARLV